MNFCETPLEGLSQGRQLRFFKKQPVAAVDDDQERDECSVCAAIHRITNQLPRHRFPFSVSALPTNGVYLLFEKGEHGHGADRIVRIGSHTGQSRLIARLIEHFMTPNKDRSIFRKNIGRAILSSRQDSFLDHWNISLTTRADRDRYGATVDPAKLAAVESEVSDHLRREFSFAVVPVDDREQRLALEASLIATVAQCPACRPSETWLGRQSPEAVIRQCGLWQKQHTTGQPLQRVPDLLGAHRPTLRYGKRSPDV